MDIEDQIAKNRQNQISEQIADIIRENDVETASKVITEILVNLAKNDPTVADAPEPSILYEINMTCERNFG